MADPLDPGVSGFKRGKKRGWWVAPPNPHQRSLDAVNAENAELRQVLADMNVRLKAVEKKRK